MRRLSLSLGFFVAAVTAGCSFRVGTKPDPNVPQPGAAQPAAAAPAAPAPAPSSGRAPIALGRVKIPAAPAGTTPPAAEPTTPPASGVPILIGTNVFGQGTPDASGWKGSFYVIPPATQNLPALATMQPAGILFAKDLNVASKPMTGGFPGINATKNEDFAIRWEAPLVVDTEADYTFRLLSDDGSKLLIDNTLIVDNDGQHTVKETSGPVHLVKGTHVVTVDYFQAAGPVALQLFCKKAGGTETVCPTHLQ
jgi:hypothetical protein